MPYDIVVCVKQVPDTANITSDAMTPEGTVNRMALPAIFNPEDLHALETALELKDRFGGTVTCLTMGPPKAANVLRDCLYRGADRVILLTDRRAAASDTLATSYILSQAVKAVGKFDIVLCGRQAIDGDTAQVGPQIAEKLGIPQITYLEEVVDADEKSITIRRNTGAGWEVVKSQLPCLITVLDTANEPRPLSACRTLKYRFARVPGELSADDSAAGQKLADKGLLIEQWDLDNISADLNRCGLAGSPTKVFKVLSIVLTKEGYEKIEPTDEGINGLIHELIEDKTL